MLLSVFFQTGTVALNFAVITGLWFLLLWIIRSFQEKRGVLYPLPLLAAFLVSSAGFLYQFINMNIPASVLIFSITGLSWAVMLLALVIWGREKKKMPLVLLVFLSYTLAYLHFWTKQDILLIVLPQAKSLLAVSELLAVMVPVLTFFIYKPRGNVTAIVLAGILSIFVFALYLLKPGVAVAVAMWNQSFTSYLPFALYPAAVWLYVYNILALYGSPSHKTTAVGLALIGLGGLRLEYNYFNLLALAGFLLLAGGGLIISSAGSRTAAKP